MTRWELRLWKILGLPFDGEGDVDVRYRRKKSMLTLNAVATLIFAAALMVVHLVVGPRVLGVIEGLLSLVFLANLFWLRRHRNTTLTAFIAAGLTLMGMVAGVQLYDGIRDLWDRGVIDDDLASHLDALRRHGNCARHADTPPFLPVDKPVVADAVYAVACAFERTFF